MNAPRNSLSEIAEALRAHRSFAVMSHVRPDGDAIGSQLALGDALEKMGKSVRYLNEDGLPENLGFMRGSERIEKTDGPVEVEVAIALDTATQPRLGDKTNAAVAGAKLWINIDHHVTNPGYGDLAHVDSGSPATGQIIYDLLTTQEIPFGEVSRDAIYVAVSTDTGSFQYSGTTARTYEMAADLVRRGLEVGPMNAAIYDNQPYRRVELLRSLLNTLERRAGGKLAFWSLDGETRDRLELTPDDSEGLIDLIRSIRGVVLAIFFEALPGGAVRVSMRSKDRKMDASEFCQQWGGGGHPLAAGIRMPGPLAEARGIILAAAEKKLASLEL